MINRSMQRFSYERRNVVSFVALAVFTVHGIASIPLATADDSRNQLPKKQHKDSDTPFLKPAEAVSKMVIPDGFQVSVFAAELDIAEPIAFCFDDRGRVWVVENFNYQTRKKHTDDPVSRIQILEDTDGDGVFDKKKTFTDRLTFTSGIACGFGGVFVGSPPNFSFIPDEDGDDVPDGPAQVLLHKSYLMDGVFRIGMKRSIVSFGGRMVGCTAVMACLRIPMLGSQVIQMHSVNLLMPVSGDTIQLGKLLKSLLVDYQIHGDLISTTTGRGVQHVVSSRIFFMSCRAARITSKLGHTSIRISMTT